jgi:hypothetical protein
MHDLNQKCGWCYKDSDFFVSLTLILTSETIYGPHNFKALKRQSMKKNVKYVILGYFVYFLFLLQVILLKSNICTI